ncbi:MAG: RluA family pseudouridine synthase, partial [Ignavibacteriae bacterium]
KIKIRVQNLLKIMPRQALHAKTLGFFHPHLNKKLSFYSDLPKDMQLLSKNLKSTIS